MEYYSAIKRSTEIYYSMDESQNHYAEKTNNSKKKKKATYCNSIYMKCPDSQIHRYRK